MDLFEFFQEHRKTALALSGGIGSNYLLFAAVARECDVKPYFILTPETDPGELQWTLRLANLLGCECVVVQVTPKGRVYRSRKALIADVLSAQIQADGYELLLDGCCAETDASPGVNHGILSPLKLCSLNRKDILHRCEEVNLPMASPPYSDALNRYYCEIN